MTKLLLDESLPRRLARSFRAEDSISTVQQEGWSSAENGALLRLAKDGGYAALVTADQNIEYQQNPDKLPIAVIVLVAHSNRLSDMEPLVPKVIELLSDLQPTIYRVTS